MKKKFSHIFTLGIGIALGSTMFSNAAATFQSSGKIQYTDQTTGNTVVFDSADFNTIENNITTGKNDILQSLQDIKTYLDADGNVIQYEQPMNPYGEIPSFEKLSEAVLKSQKVPALENVNVTNKDGAPLFYSSEIAKTNKDIIDVTTSDPGFSEAQMKGYIPATEDNLTAGTAAWVDGELILGNGADNDAFYEKARGYLNLVDHLIRKSKSVSYEFQNDYKEVYLMTSYSDANTGDETISITGADYEVVSTITGSKPAAGLTFHTGTTILRLKDVKKGTIITIDSSYDNSNVLGTCDIFYFD